MNYLRLTTFRLAIGLLFTALAACGAERNDGGRPSLETIKAGKALFDERCRTVAGEKIYRRVENVEGIVLLKVRPDHPRADFADRDFPGAAFAKEYSGDSFIRSFLGYEHSSSQKGEPVSPTHRGYIAMDYQPNNPSNLPGYRYVDAPDEVSGKLLRYTGSERVVPTASSTLIGGDGKTHMVKRYVLDRSPAPEPGPRYGVTYEDHVIPEERALGLASSTVKVLDLQTREVLGEMTLYAWTHGVLFKDERIRKRAVPWLSASRCGNSHHWAGFETRLFVDQVLIPKMGE
jgi:hypothetical protein